MHIPATIKSSRFATRCAALWQRFGAWRQRHPIWALILLSLVLALLVEMLSRRSPAEGVVYLFTHPLPFVCNALIIMLTLSIAFLFPKRGFFLLLISLIWLGIATANCVLLGYRTAPLAAIDFALLPSFWGLVSIYMSVFQLVLIAVGFLVLVAVMIYSWIKMPKHKLRLLQALALVGVTGLCLFVCTHMALAAGVVDDEFPDLPRAYDEYGFAYCFSWSLLDRGIDKPADYSEDRIEEILKDIGGESSTKSKLRPNIIFLQLESYFDLNTMEDITFSEDPVPSFTELRGECASGYLTVPSIGAGTANTEFEVISGMSLDYFGTGEYPYKTILQETACESVCFDLRELGYTSHAIHNSTGTFYDRNTVFSSLGFDTFTSIEYMHSFETNPLGWAKDYVLTPEILRALSSTEDQDLIYAISVQAHGRYPTEVIDPDQHITVSGLNEDQIPLVSFEYYVNQIHETDAFIGALVAALSNYEEPTLLVLYGDHLPSFEITAEELITDDLFETEYLIWNNFGLELSDRDLCSYQLYSYVLDCLGMDNGMITKLHQRYATNPNYQQALELLEYDMLYGDHEMYDGGYPYAPTDLQMGTVPIIVSDMRSVGGSLFVYGTDFTRSSVVCVDGKKQDTTYLSATSLLVSDYVPDEGAAVTVAQYGEGGEYLSETNARTYHNS